MKTAQQKTKADPKSIYLTWGKILLFIAFLSVVAGCVNSALGHRQTQSLNGEGIGVSGTITGIERNQGGRYSPTDYRVDYKYLTTNSQEEIGSGYLDGSVGYKYKVGDTLTILYNQDKPTESIMALNQANFNSIFGFFFMAIVLVIISVILITMSRRTRNATK